ncbi:DUF5906 domain-containing protein [Paraburkholderia sp. MMS20-SJTN17]|uniref:DUF5906 domain-containing protein n=1 Tax=Paraburkholderia translucens TaxID=2886945 RepID=A0ABS8K8B1_9BURK|nr:primase-helicase family protein [Paraburkholderia sp. MMS20-SJTN17]MCC8400954.1 DUF5906 domain-containing protein [Paraburkholderia sp. MMS20-SJTN17]
MTGSHESARVAAGADYSPGRGGTPDGARDKHKPNGGSVQFATNDAQVRQFVDLARPDGGALTILSIAAAGGAPAARTFDVPAENGALVAYVRKHNSMARNVYWLPNGARVRDCKPDKTGMTRAHFCWADCDPDVAQYGTYDAARAHLLGEHLERLALVASFVIDSGHGLQAFFQLAEPVALPGCLEAFERVNAAIGHAFDGPGTFNCDRIMRLPGTTNYPTPPKLAKGYPAAPSHAKVLCSAGRVYTLDELAGMAIPRDTHDDEVRHRFEALLKTDAKLRARWQGSVEGLTDTSGSARDFSLYAMLVARGFTHDDAVDLMTPWECGSINGRAQGARYWERMRERSAVPAGSRPAPAQGYSVDDFFTYLPAHKYLHVPTGELWPASSVNAKLPPVKVSGDQCVSACSWLDEHRAVMQIVWMPGEPQVIADRVMQAAGWQTHAGAQSFNLYLPAAPVTGDASKVGPWIGHLERLYPDDWPHLVSWFAHTVQHPEDKINHAIVLGGGPGIGKDTLLEPLRLAVGAHNTSDITPAVMFGRFNRWVRNKLVRVSEVRDLGDLDRYAFYEHCKPYLASPPDVIRVDEKNLREYYVANVSNVIFTTNHLTDGLYLPADDRRHYVCWSTCTSADFTEAYFRKLWTWYAAGGMANVVAFLRERNIATFDAKAPPPKTPAFWQTVAAGESTESGEMRDLLDLLRNPDAVTLTDLIDGSMRHGLSALENELGDRKNRRRVPHVMERAGYVNVRNPDADSGLFQVAGRRVAIYAKRSMTVQQQIQAARERTRRESSP